MYQAMASNTQSTDYQSISSSQKLDSHHEHTPDEENPAISRPELRAGKAQKEHSFTLRGVLVGLAVGLVTCFSNMYFGLQSGWISPMSMPSSLMGFVYFKMVSRHLDLPFTPVENVLVQSVAGGMGTMPLGCGFVGVMPVLNYMLTPEEQGPIFLSLWKLILWSLGLCFFGVVFAVPLRKQVIIREKLKFPSGTATALMIGMLHGKKSVTESTATHDSVTQNQYELNNNIDELAPIKNKNSSWKTKSRLLAFAFIASGIYTFATYFFPILRNLPIFGRTMASSWLWTLNPSLAYVGQGAIMGPKTTIHMLLGAVVGWGVLSPLAKYHGWAPGSVDDWETGSKGWIVWIALAIMLADSIISLGHIGFSSLSRYGYNYLPWAHIKTNRFNWKRFLGLSIFSHDTKGYAPIIENGNNLDSENSIIASEDFCELDAPPEHRVQNSTVVISGVLSILICVGSIQIAFGALIPIYATVIAVFMALVLSLMGVRALGETDLNPVSGISKIAQFFFAFIVPRSNKNSVLINLVAGSISEAGALQAGDLLQDLKTGHLLGAAPAAQFWGQIIGSAVGAVTSALIYQLYTSVYKVPGELFQVPTGHVWIFTARLVTGQGLPAKAWEWSLGAAIIFSLLTLLGTTGLGKKWNALIPGGIAVAVGMYNVPSFTLARTAGGILSWYWKNYQQREESLLIIIASGLILGEGVVSILCLVLASMRVPHL